MRTFSDSLGVAPVVLALGLLGGLAGCGGTSYYGVDPHACDGSQAPGAWDVSLDYGGGKTVLQRWTITRDYRSLTIVAEPRDEYSPPSDYRVGLVQDPGFWADWINTVGACKYYVEMTATVAGNSFAGPIDWYRKDGGTGECVPAQGRILATAVRQ